MKTRPLFSPLGWERPTSERQCCYAHREGNCRGLSSPCCLGKRRQRSLPGSLEKGHIYNIHRPAGYLLVCDERRALKNGYSHPEHDSLLDC